MPPFKVPINDGLFMSDLDSELGPFSPVLINAYLDEFGNKHKIPGSVERGSVGDTVSITGLHPWAERNIIIAVDSSGNVYKMAQDYTVTNITGDKLLGTNPPTFADNGSVLVIADGGRMVFTDGSSNTAFIGDVDAPTNVTHVVFYNQYIVASKAASDTYYWSEVGDYTDWGALSFSTAESSPDPTLALIKRYQELMFLGMRSIERWRDYGTESPFARIPGTTIDTFGIGAAYTTRYVGGVLIFLDTFGRIVTLSGFQPKNIGRPIQRALDQLTKISDAYSHVLEINGKLFYAITFPTDNISWWYDVRLDKWQQTGFWRDGKYKFDAHIMRSYAYMPPWNVHLIGDRRQTGKILELSGNVYQDDGNEIRYLQQSGRYNVGTLRKKSPSLMSVRAKRGVGNVEASTAPKLMFRHKEDKNWSGEKQLDMGIVGDFDPVMKFSIHNKYNARSVELSYTENTPMVISGAEEEVRVLER